MNEVETEERAHDYFTINGIKHNQRSLQEIIDRHGRWAVECGIVRIRINDKVKAERADLSGADLRKANLQGVCLRMADLNGADLQEANLKDTDLWRSNLSNANLRKAELKRKWAVDPIVRTA